LQKEEILSATKPFTIPKKLVMKAFKLVKAKDGAAGVDQQTLTSFEESLQDNLYKLWNRLSSGSYFPPPVKAVAIPKKTGGERILGVPTISDRIAQMVVKLVFEPLVEPYFYPDSYGYRVGKSALEAIGITRQRCWKSNWILEFDIKGLFDNIPHELLLKAVRKHTDNKWVLLYIERWLQAPIELPNGEVSIRTKGTPQGGVISPILSNLFLHYVFDNWMNRQYRQLKWCRYADDGLVHGDSEQEMQELLVALKQRFKECGLELHPEKTKIVYCKDDKRKGEYPNTEFTFLGYSFRRRKVKNSKDNSIFVSFNPAVSKDAQKSMRAKIRKSSFSRKTDVSIQDIAEKYNPILRGWMEYYGKYHVTELYKSVMRHFNTNILKWLMRKYKKFKGSKAKAGKLLKEIAKRDPSLFVHWEKGIIDTFA
jgi:RNA-directed DNA polymerase